MDLNGKVVVITGSSSGLGKALAKKFKENGAKVILNSVSKEELENTSRELGLTGVLADVSREEEVKTLAQRAVSDFGKIDIWVNNAGTWLPHGSFLEVPTERVMKIMSVNFLGNFLGSKEAVLEMKKQGGGTILNILSIRVFDPTGGSAVYTASKFAADGLSRSLRLELEGDGISVLNVYPGGMRTELFQEKMPENYNDYMDPEDVANRIVENLKLENPVFDLILKREI